jgi:single-stranded-DNA-specific exonuclease
MKRWELFPTISQQFIEDNPGIDPLLLQLLFNRGLKEHGDISAFLNPAAFFDPFLFKNMGAAVDLLIKHLKAGDKILVYGDYDADGVTSSVILLETLRILHASADAYLPDRVSEGYGLNKPAIKQAAIQGFKLIITVDNGIRNREEVAYAKQLGVDVIITDHHVLPEGPDSLPDCPYIDPADPSDPYPWKYLAGVGVSFKLISALLAKSSLPEKQKTLIAERCLDLVAVGTIADMVNLLGENRCLVKEGLRVLNQNRRHGLNELVRVAKISSGRPLESWNVSWQIAPRLNAASRLAHANDAFALLSTDNKEEAEILANELNQRNISRQQITEEIIKQVEDQIDKDNLPPVIIGVAGEGQIWNEGVVGLVAGRIVEKYYRPALIISRLVESAEFDPETKKLKPKEVSFKGSGRSIEGFNLIKAIESSSEFLDKYGGHYMACGFSLKSEKNLELFRQKLISIAEQEIPAEAYTPKLKIEAELPFSKLNQELAAMITDLAPFGQNNPQPRFVSYSLLISDIATMGFESQHIKFRLTGQEDKSVKAVWAIAFGAAKDYQDFKVGDSVDIVYYLEINEFNGRRETQLKIIDLRLSEKTATEK